MSMPLSAANFFARGDAFNLPASAPSKSPPLGDTCEASSALIFFSSFGASAFSFFVAAGASSFFASVFLSPPSNKAL